MEKNIVIISAAETFSVRGIEMKLAGIGVHTVYSAPEINELKSKLDPAGLILLYTDEDVADKIEILVFLKDHCVEHNKQVMVIGSADEYDSVCKHISNDHIAAFFRRPLEIETLLDDVNKYFSEGNDHRKSILIVDDNVTYMSMIMDWLKDSYRVSMANSGVKAITWLATDHADLILLDYEMPVTTGPEVLEMIRSQPDLSEIPVMFLTGVSDKESIVKVLSLKPVDYLLKSIDRDGLREKIDLFFRSGH